MTERDHNFRCPSCDAEGIITLQDEFTTFGCPEECGARFAKYQGLAGWHIKCVVLPVRRADGETAAPCGKEE